MVEPLSVNTDGVRTLSGIHAGVATGLGSLNAGAPGSADVAASHGPIAFAVDTALSAALGSRSATMTTTAAAGDEISELLKQAAIAYERGDQRGAAAIRAAAEALSRGETASAGVGGVPPGTAGASSPGGGADALGQAVGQLGQLGQIGQLLGAPLAALAQPLQQLPQQIMQGVQQLARSASQTTGSDKGPTLAAGSGPDVGGSESNERESEEHDPEEATASGDRDSVPSTEHEDPTGAAPSGPSGAGSAPVTPGPRPAPTRPAVD